VTRRPHVTAASKSKYALDAKGCSALLCANCERTKPNSYKLIRTHAERCVRAWVQWLGGGACRAGRSITRSLDIYVAAKPKAFCFCSPTLTPHTLHAAAELMEISIGVHHARRCHGCLPLLLILARRRLTPALKYCPLYWPLVNHARRLHVPRANVLCK
jgi:hypothetical protein